MRAGRSLAEKMHTKGRIPANPASCAKRLQLVADRCLWYSIASQTKHLQFVEMVMERRRFIKQILLSAAGFSLSAPLIRIAAAGAPPPLKPDIARVKGSDYAALVRATVDLLGGMKQFVKKGQRVVVKPNIGWDRRPEQGATTHPVVVRTLVEMACEAGAGEVNVFDFTCNEKRRCYNSSGISDALASIGDKRVNLSYVDKRKFIPTRIVDGKALKEWAIYGDVLKADSYINVPIAKHHGLSRLTLGLKNQMGVVGGRRGTLHHNIGQNLADLLTVIRPTLTVIDATRVLLDNGPQGGSLDDVRHMDTLLASTDPVAADALATTLFDLEPKVIASTVAASAMGLGEMNPDNMNIMERSV